MERDAGLGIVVHHNRDLIRSELSWVQKLGTVTWVVGECTQTQSSKMCIDKEENDGEKMVLIEAGLRFWRPMVYGA